MEVGEIGSGVERESEGLRVTGSLEYGVENNEVPSFCLNLPTSVFFF